MNLTVCENFSNLDLENIVTPLNVKLFEELLIESDYDIEERQFLVKGFSEGFDIGYTGPKARQSRSRNIPFTVGDKYDMWGKIMKEVKAGRYAGPYEEVPFENFIQSPVGLVPKAGNKTRLIFHLSFNFEDGKSVNAHTPRDECSVHYNNLDTAVANCLAVAKEALHKTGKETIFLGKTDLSMAFRVLPMKIACFCWLVLMAEDPRDGKMKYFVDKCLPFGSSISCAHYQRFSNSLKHLIQYKTKCKRITNYLDDFLFAAITRLLCNYVIGEFVALCEKLRIPVAYEKTEWGCTLIVFLGILLDGERMLLSLPIEKQEKALRLLNDITGKKRITVKNLQILTGYLNFLTKAIPAGRTFTRRMYAKFTGLDKKLKSYHHVKIDSEFKFDCDIWRVFLSNYKERAVCRPMIDMSKIIDSVELDFYSDASAGEFLGFGAIYEHRWLFGQWEKGFIKQKPSPSIEFLELYALAAAVLTWGNQIQNKRITIFCDNMGVVGMINSSTSSCKNCMFLLRLLILDNLIHNRKISAKYVRSQDNKKSDALSRLQLDKFWQLSDQFTDKCPTPVSALIWPPSSVWNKSHKL